MNNLIRAELLKLRTTRTFWWSVVAALTFVPLSIALAIAKIGTPDGTSLDSVEGFRNVIAAASSGGMLVLLIGIMVMAGEFDPASCAIRRRGAGPPPPTSGSSRRLLSCA